MSTCEQELCPFWNGDGCPCAVLRITDAGRRREQHALGIHVPEDDA